MDIEHVVNIVKKDISEIILFEEPDEYDYTKSFNLKLNKSGRVYIITNMDNNIKFLAKYGNSNILSREIEVLKILKNSHSPSFLEYYDYHIIGECCVIFMQLADGSLDEIFYKLKEECKKSVLKQWILITKLLNTLGIIQCDIKLENVVYIIKGNEKDCGYKLLPIDWDLASYPKNERKECTYINDINNIIEYGEELGEEFQKELQVIAQSPLT